MSRTTQSAWTTFGLLLMAFVVSLSLVRMGQKLASGATAPIAGTPRVAATDATVGADGIQRVTLAMGRLNYNPDTIRVRRGVPVELIADQTLAGCFTSFVLPELNVWKQFTATDRRLAFTPNRAGTFRFTCAMGMGRGQLIVEG